MISETKSSQSVEKPRWNPFSQVFNNVADAAKSVFNFQEDPDEFTLIPKPSLIANFSREIRMMGYALGGLIYHQTPEQKRILDYLIEKIEKSRQLNLNHSASEIASTKQLIGKVLFLADCCPESLKEIVQYFSDPKDLIHHIDQHFTSKLSVQSIKLKIHCETQAISQIPTPKKSPITNAHLSIAQLLVTDNGLINTGIAPQVIKELKSRPASDDLYTCEELIEDLTTDEELQGIFNFIAGPLDDSLTYDLIRSILGLKSDESVTSSHAKKAVLSALMDLFCDQPRMEKGKLRQYMLKMMSLCSDLIPRGTGLSLSDLAEDPNVLKPFDINKDGEINHTPVMFWDHPGLIAIGRQLGINSLQNIWNDFRQFLFEEKQEEAKCRPIDLVDYLVEQAIIKNPSLKEDRNEIRQLEIVAFTSTQSNILVELIKLSMRDKKKKLNNLVEQVAIKAILQKNRPLPVSVREEMANEAIKELVNIGETIAHIRINENMHLNIFEFIYANMVPSAIQKEFHEIDTDIYRGLQKTISIKDYAFKILDLANQLTDATPIQQRENLKKLSAYLLCRGLEENLQKTLWECAIKVDMEHPIYQTLGYNFYITYDFLSGNLIRIATNSSRNHVEILENLEWDHVIQSIIRG